MAGVGDRVLEHLDSMVMGKAKDIEDRDFLAAETMALLGVLLAYTQPAAVPVLEHACGRCSMPQ